MPSASAVIASGRSRVSAQTIDLGYRPRQQFIPFHKRTQRYAAGVAHRRAGKTVACIMDLVDAALRIKAPNGRFAYLAPYFSQAKDVAWSYLKQYTLPIPGSVAHEAELRVDLPNGSRIRLYGADNADRLRGIYLDGAVFDEYADMEPRVWPEVIRPALSDRRGWAVFIGTPKGRNSFWHLYEKARADPEWMTFMLKADETGILPSEELEAARKSMTGDQFAQEFLCSFQAAVMGSYYGKIIEALEAQKRIGRVPYDPAVRVHTAWDLGVGDQTAIWFAQMVGKEVHLIDFYQSSGVGLDHYVNLLQRKPYVYADEHIVPHDAAARELGTGRSRIETLKSLGITARALPALSIDDGINAARMLLPRCWFDDEKCAPGIESLRLYRAEYDTKREALRARPLHDKHSDAADAFRYLAMGIKEQDDKKNNFNPFKSPGWQAA